MRKYAQIIFSLLILVGLFSACFNPKKYDDIKPTGIITMTSPDSSVAADGAGSYNVRATIDNKADPSKRTVIFKTTLGTFKGGSDSIVVTADANFTCTAKLTSVKAGTASVTAKAQNVTAARTAKVTFQTVIADKITVAVDSFAIKNDFRSEALITATLRTSGGGQPSVGQAVGFSVTDKDLHDVGLFLNNIHTGTTDANGQVKLRYSAGDSPYIGNLTITASSADSLGNPITGTTLIYLKK